MTSPSISYVAPTGMLGSGFAESSFDIAIGRGPAFIGVDAGSTDGGPHRLGAGVPTFGRTAVRRDLRLCLVAARRLGIPLLVGSSQGAGIDQGVDDLAQLTIEIAKEEGLSFNLARIYAEPDRELLKARLVDGRVHALRTAPAIDAGTIDRSAHIVAMMGTEPLVEALGQGADVVLAGRASDTSMFSAIPERDGFPRGLVWHAAKVMECGSAATANRKGQDSMYCTVSMDDFVLDPPNPDLRCTPLSVAAHGLYENGDPSRLMEPGGTLDTADAGYEALDERRVRVTGSRFEPAPAYTVKLEGAELVGYESFTLGSVRDPIILRQLDRWVAGIEEQTARRIENDMGLRVGDDYDYYLRVYGRDGTLGPLEPTPRFEGHEALLFIGVVAPTADLANTLILAAKHVAMHYPVPEWTGSITGFAHPLTPGCIDRGPVYRFNMNHVVELDHPCEPYRFAYEEVAP